MRDKHHLLNDFAQRVARAAAGSLLARRPLAVRHVETVSGPRAGALHVFAGLDAGRLLKALSANDCAVLRQFVPWEFSGSPVAYMHGRALRLEAGWPPELAENDIPLADLAPFPKGGGCWVAGKNEHGLTVVAGLNEDRTPHWLVSGQTGAGKTVAIRSALVQLAADPDNMLVVVDGKRGASFGGCGLRAMAGPLATRPDDWRRALVWATSEMMRRYDNGGGGRLVVVVDEVQEVILADAAAAEAIRRLVVLGRDAGVFCLLATQHPIVAALGGPTVTRNLVGRLALRASDFDASRVAIGGPDPRADHLLGRGDCYAVSPTAVHRVQVAYTTEADFDAVAGDPLMAEWPDAAAEDLGRCPAGGRPSPWPTSTEVGVAIAAARLGRGRPWLKGTIEDDSGSRPGSDRARRLLALGREVFDWLEDYGFRLGLDLQVVTVS